MAWSTRVLGLSLWWVVACRHPPVPTAGVDAAQVAPRVPDAAAPAPSVETEPERQALVRRALERVPKIREDVARLRGLASRAVLARYQSQEEFGSFLRAELDLELPAAKSAATSRALFHIGLLKKDLDLRSALENAMLSQAGAYYDPARKTFNLVMVPKSPDLLDGIAAHELTHAVQDQNFDLTRYLGGRGNTQGLSEDALTARRFVVEGEATLVMFAQMAQAMTQGQVNLLDPAKRSILRQQIDGLARMDVHQLAAMSAVQGVFLDLGEEMQKSIAAIPHIPSVVLVPLFDSYFKGAKTVLEVYAHGGWEAVNALYTSPPSSTEQVLHPVEKLITARDEPVKVVLSVPPALKDFTLLYSDVLGELLWRVYFQNWGSSDPNGAASGWDGDRVSVYAQGDLTVALLQTAWDSEEEAIEFEKAYRATLPLRPGGGHIQVDRQRDRVYITDGTGALNSNP